MPPRHAHHQARVGGAHGVDLAGQLQARHLLAGGAGRQPGVPESQGAAGGRGGGGGAARGKGPGFGGGGAASKRADMRVLAAGCRHGAQGRARRDRAGSNSAGEAHKGRRIRRRAPGMAGARHGERERGEGERPAHACGPTLQRPGPQCSAARVGALDMQRQQGAAAAHPAVRPQGRPPVPAARDQQPAAGQPLHALHGRVVRAQRCLLAAKEVVPVRGARQGPGEGLRHSSLTSWVQAGTKSATADGSCTRCSTPNVRSAPAASRLFHRWGHGGSACPPFDGAVQASCEDEPLALKRSIQHRRAVRKRALQRPRCCVVHACRLQRNNTRVGSRRALLDGLGPSVCHNGASLQGAASARTCRTAPTAAGASPRPSCRPAAAPSRRRTAGW